MWSWYSFCCALLGLHIHVKFTDIVNITTKWKKNYRTTASGKKTNWQRRNKKKQQNQTRCSDEKAMVCVCKVRVAFTKHIQTEKKKRNKTKQKLLWYVSFDCMWWRLSTTYTHSSAMDRTGKHDGQWMCLLRLRTLCALFTQTKRERNTELTTRSTASMASSSFSFLLLHRRLRNVRQHAHTNENTHANNE